jgi:hypothetical protein
MGDTAPPSGSSLLQEDEFDFANPTTSTSTTSNNTTTTNTNTGGHSMHSNMQHNMNMHHYDTKQQQHQTQQQQQGNPYPFVEVVAPASLKGGYTFDVEVNHEIFTVEVPTFGVSKGQSFQAQTVPKVQETSALYRIPIGLWKDGLGDFCKYGPFHSSIFLACLFPLVSLGQVYTRLDLSWNGSPMPITHHPVDNSTNASSGLGTGTLNSTRNMAFKVMVILTSIYVFTKQIIAGNNLSYHYIYIVNLVYFITITLLVGRTRRHIREKYDIPATFTQLQNMGGGGSGGRNDSDYGPDGDGFMSLCCGEMEDYCLGGFCYPCVVSQMNRHTAMYDTYEGECCSSNGLPKHAPDMI